MTVGNAASAGCIANRFNPDRTPGTTVMRESRACVRYWADE